VCKGSGDLDLLHDLMSGSASIGSLERSSVWRRSRGRTDGAEDGIRKSGCGQTRTREDREMASAIRLADTNWSEHVMRDGHVPGSPYSSNRTRIARGSLRSMLLDAVVPKHIFALVCFP
jgi:hypothetical protein